MANFSTPLSGLQAQSTAIDIVGNNLANLNTTGFKSSSASFRDLISASLGASGAQVGQGVQTPLSVRKFQQGSIQQTGGAFDVAIGGQGFFVVRDSQGRQLFTRAGDFKVDAAGNLLTQSGERVQGWTSSGGVLSATGAIGNIVVPSGGTSKPVPTSIFSADLNLNAGAAAGQPNGTFSTAVEVVDSLGAKHVLTLTFTKTASNAWDYKITIPGQEVTGGVAGTPSSVATGSLTFDTQGNLTAPAPPPPAANGVVAVTIPAFTNGAAALNPKWSLYDASFKPRVTQYSQPSAASATAQDGLVASSPVQVSLADGGQIVAQYSDGRQQVVAQIALASIRNPDSLISVGGNNFLVSALTSEPTIGAANAGGLGQILSGSLESSTVDIAKEFTNLIVYQRGYQANSKVITTLDELSQETINIKR